MKPYTSKSLTSAIKRVRQLRKQVAERDAIIKQFDQQRKTLANLASDSAMFYNPFDAMDAKKLRDQILRSL